MKFKSLSLLAGLAIAPLTAKAQLNNPINDAFEDLLENFIVLDASAVGLASSESNLPVFSFDTAVRLQSVDVKAKSAATRLSAPRNFGWDAFDSDALKLGVSVGYRGDINLASGLFPNGVGANGGVFGTTPTLGAHMWLGNDELGLLLESDYGILGPNNGWVGSASLGYNILNQTPQPYDRDFSGLSEVLLAVSASMMDEVYAKSTREGLTEDFTIGVDSIGASLEFIYDFGSGIRIGLPIKVEHKVGKEFLSDDSTTDMSLGLSLGYRYE